MKPNLSAIPLAATDAKRGAAVLARAFQTDPFFVFVLPDPEKRGRVLPWLFERLIQYGLRYGRAYTTLELEGVALWQGTGEAGLSLWGTLTSGLWLLPLQLSPGELSRSIRLSHRTDQLHARCLVGPHWQLLELGVDPRCQGKGLGGTLMQPMLSQADRLGVQCYLDTTEAQNLIFYAKHGFELVGEERISRQAPPVFALVRPPKPLSSTMATP